MRGNRLTMVFVLAALIAPTFAHAQERTAPNAESQAAPTAQAGQGAARSNAAQVRRALVREPSVDQTVQAALRFFRATPDALDRLRSAARARGAVPLIAVGYRFDQLDSGREFTQTMFQPNTQDESSLARTHAVSAGAIWDLRELVSNPTEIQAYGVVGVQRDVILEITRTYFMRRQLIVRLMMRPPEDEVARLTLELRVEELTALLDTMTGGWYGRALSESRTTQREN